MHTFSPSGVCAKAIHFEIEQDTLKRVIFERGCPGSLQGIAKLVEGQPVAEVMQRLEGITCGPKSTSCPDQLYRALQAYVKQSA